MSVTAKFHGGPLDGTIRALEEATDTFKISRPAPDDPRRPSHLLQRDIGIYDRMGQPVRPFPITYRWRGWQT